MNPVNLALRTFGSLVSPSGRNGRLSILIYHRVLKKADPLLPFEVDAERFDAQMAALKAICNVIPLYEAVQGLESGKLPSRAACITFDDGYADNHDVALPILEKHNLHATFFVSTGYLDGGIMFNDKAIEIVRRAERNDLDLSGKGLGVYSLERSEARRKAVGHLLSDLKYKPLEERNEIMDSIAADLEISFPEDIMMTSSQVKALHDAGMEIGGHTVHHPILSRLENAAARKEMMEGKARLEEITGNRVRIFAYPNGIPGRDYLVEHARMAKDLGFEAAVSTAKGVSRSGSDLFQLPRFTPWDMDISRFSMRLAANLLQTDFATVGRS